MAVMATQADTVGQARLAISVIVPARNEERLLPATLDAIAAAQARVAEVRGETSETIVVDHNSTDATAQISRRHGAQVVSQIGGSIAAVRNSGASAARGETLVFVDADACLPPHTLVKIQEAIDEGAIAGYPSVIYEPRRRIMRLYLRTYGAFGRLTGMSQGTAQFCRQSTFDAVGGYDEEIFMGEDVDFMWRVRRRAKAEESRVVRLADVRLTPSSRRFDNWPLWRVLLFTNPLVVRPLMRERGAWSGWYESGPR